MFFIVIFTIIFFIALYYVVKLAVKNALREEKGSGDIYEDGQIQQVKCINCGEKYDIDYVRCPYCKGVLKNQ